MEPIADLRAGFALLTRLPVGRAPIVSDPARGVWAYTVVGAAVGCIGAAADALARAADLPPLLAAIWTLAAMALATGALHEDGLADTADGFGGGRDAAGKLAIMRDSRIGTFGAVALVLSFAIRAAALAAITDPAAGLIAVATLARAAMIVVLLVLRPARRDGLASGLGALPRGPAAAGVGAAVLVALLLLPTGLAAPALGAAALTALGMAALVRRQIGGYTGDVLGATAVLTECVVLSVLVSRQ